MNAVQIETFQSISNNSSNRNAEERSYTFKTMHKIISQLLCEIIEEQCDGDNQFRDPNVTVGVIVEAYDSIIEKEK